MSILNKLAFPSAIPDNKTIDTRKDSRSGSVIDQLDNPNHYKTLNENANNIDNDEELKFKGTLKGRRSEEPPDIYGLNNRLTEISTNENKSPDSLITNTSPKFAGKNIKMFKIKTKNTEQKEQPVQNIMKVGNLFMFNVYK